MKNKMTKILLSVIIGIIIAYYIGAMFNFFPFIADDLTIRAIGFCTLIISVVIAVCTCIIISNKKE